MHGRTIILGAILAAGVVLPDTVHAQLSPQGVIGGITRPFRQMLGHFGHFPRSHRHRIRPRAAAAAPSSETPAIAEFRLGWVGPPAWPSAYEDVLGFTLWPDDYASRARGHGFNVIADTISRRFDLPRMSARATTASAVRSDADNDSSNQCDDASSTQDSWPATRVKQNLQLSDAQSEALERLQAATVQSIKAIKAGCQELGGLSPPDRLRTLVQMLWIVRDAGISVQEPLKTFYESLTKAQKNNFASQLRLQNAPPDPQIANSGLNKQYQACAAQTGEKAERLVKEIRLKARPKRDQAASLDEFHKVASDMAKLLTATCAQPIPADPLARLDTANDQLTAMNYAATNIQIAFDNFYSRLDNNQKARFDSSGR
jgi:hypothetical protein